MKGMQKIRRGKGFAGVVLYALKPGSHHRCTPYVIGGNMMGDAERDLIAEFNTTKTLRSDVAKPVWHNSLRLPKNEALTDTQWSKIADDYMARMGFSETHLRCYVLHDDIDGQHIHIIASRIDLNAGKLYLGKNENLISTRIIQQLEIDHHLTRTKGPESGASQSPASPYSKSKRKKSRNEAMMEKKTGELCPKTIIQETLDTLLIRKLSTTEFVQQLAAHNIKALPNIASTGKMNGFSFEYGGIAFKASQLGKGYSWSALQHRLDYQPERDNPFLFRLKMPSVSEASVSEALDMTIATDTPKIIKEDVNSPIEALILNNEAGQGEYAINYPKALLPDADVKEAYATEAVKEAGAGGKEAHVTEALKEASRRKPVSMVLTGFRWLETIPYLNIIIEALRKLKVPILKRPGKHNTITGVKVIEITTTPKNMAEIPSIHSNRSPSM
ncbi:relaxase/mobilization nuclease domain-containing protein [Pectobacterium aroidearum]|uniref:relaxase/mobilization nuclease domain-containing protein n=1 Tax=Pectobacterium aroidearum TaxID=1201031 RepID=UPI00211565A2|nr:relaxase/mobilization nuclease domain-containing protein [Pectobacterium aroidearum]UUE58993.1 relaxase/mobilization nuclease domain-containing protein [Pectobacterium aroidearum]UUE71820.1 relaxase/mobilization nuclease domain-containing protein [Pectobacterium aroidearum]UUE76221.1 relaxase/mobilization nuclease domain-containing protein [Pectobacterium aroidearum]UUE80446.1 relaxase/mobilization nuclease domain-containing protein [Pectobacterium aroidearum]